MLAIVLALSLSTARGPVCGPPRRHPLRSMQAKAAFMRAHPCPAGPDKGSTRRCRGHIIDHICALAGCGGCDRPDNMQWQTTAAAKAKDRVEGKACAQFCRAR